MRARERGRKDGNMEEVEREDVKTTAATTTDHLENNLC